MSPRAAWRLESLGFDDVRDYAGGKLDWMAFGLPIQGGSAAIPTLAAVLRADAPSCQLSDSVAAALQQMAAGGWSWCAVLNASGIVMGRLRRAAAERAPQDATAVELMEEGPSTYRPDVPCEEIVDRMKVHRFEFAFVTDADGRWLGLASRQAAEELLDKWRSGLPS